MCIYEMVYIKIHSEKAKFWPISSYQISVPFSLYADESWCARKKSSEEAVLFWCHK
jgi:hypothetical protein